MRSKKDIMEDLEGTDILGDQMPQLVEVLCDIREILSSHLLTKKK